ncbi:MAG: hypothetical protein JWN48_3634 [Myxococcaceae bacterium]|nr:hypothetical protein [Myxococcaceae bacterium]
MLFLRGRWPRVSSSAALLSLSTLAIGCLQEPPPDYKYQSLDASGEVFRVFCRRVARAAHPTDPSGDRFYSLCDGSDSPTPVEPADDENGMLKTLIGRRPQIIAALRQTFGETMVDGSPLIDGAQTYEPGELGGFLSSLVPMYDLPDERIPKATRDIATMLDKVVDENDERANKVIETAARLSARVGYRPPSLVLGAARPILSYDGLDKLADELLTVVAEGGSAHEQWLNVLRSAALELADEAVPVSDPNTSTLKIALDLLFTTDPTLAGKSGVLPVLERDGEGNAKTTAAAAGVDPLPTPFLVPDRDDGGQSRDATTLAVSGGEPLYSTIDANSTILAAAMRETSKLIDRGGEDRSGLESISHGIKPLLGKWVSSNLTIGQNDYAYQGPDVDKAPLLDFVHSLALLARYPETQELLQVLTQLLKTHESEATATVYGGLAINDFANKDTKAHLNGPHEFWDDLIDAGNQVLEREGLLEALIRTFVDPKSAQQGPLFANWMLHNDVVTYKNAPIVINPPGPYTDQQKADINAPVVQPLMNLVDRGMPDTGMNRSIWQRTMSLINALNGVPVCNKKGAILNVPTTAGIVFTFPAGNPAGYDECGLISFNDAVEVYIGTLLTPPTTKVVIKDDIATGLAVLGGGLQLVGTVPEITEKESQLTGFKDIITPQSTARFIFAPLNKFLSDLFDPLKTKDGVAIRDYEPYALFPMENPDADAGGNFISISVPLVSAFDKFEIRGADGKLPKGYMFGNLLSVLHKHWASKQDGTCGGPVMAGNEGCVQSSDPKGKFYSAGTNLVSYEQIIAHALKDQDYLGILHNATVALTDPQVAVNGKDGIQVLSAFVKRLLTPDPSLKTRDGKGYTKTNTCVETTGMDGMPACAGGAGRIIPVLTPLYVVLDALKTFDTAFAEPANKDRLDIWHAGRSKLVDQLLTVTRNGAAGTYQYELTDRNAYAIAVAALPWISNQIQSHTAAGDVPAWSDGLAGRLGKILKHPVAAAAIDLLEAFWPEADASGQFEKVAATLLNEGENPDHFRGMLVSAADLLTLLQTDQNLSPAIQFAALGLAPDAFDAVGGSAVPDVEHGIAYAGLELARDTIHLGIENKGSSDYTTISKLLRNVVLSDGNARSPAEVIYDATADVNRIQLELPTEKTLDADEDRQVLSNVSAFIHDDDDEKRSLERLYHVIQARSLKGN